VIEWTQPGDNGSLEISLKYSGDRIEITVKQLIFAGEPAVVTGTK
jgi:hypothetical protein